MATPLDLGLIKVFSWIFPLLLVYALVLGILTYTKMFNPAVNQIISISIALLMLVVPSVLELIKFIAPMVAIVLVVVLLLVMLMKFLGVSDKTLSDVVSKDATVFYWALFVFVIIVLAAIGKVYFAKGTFLEEKGTVEGVPEAGLEGTEEYGERSFWLTLFHPNVLGMIVVLLIAAFAMFALGGKAK
jgi:hypothetical protein